MFDLDGTPIVVVPEAESESDGDIQCCGEQLLEFLRRRVQAVSSTLIESPGDVGELLPLDRLIDRFLGEAGQALDIQNWISRETHIRRIRLTNPSSLFAESSCLCPFETPEGPWIGKVLTIAAGARIENGRLEAGDDAMEIGPAASYIPFLDRDDPGRLLMGSNMMRQWIEPADREAALVQTGTEPETPEFWCGFNLLTAFTAYGRCVMEDGILLSESAVRRMRYPEGVKVGDKLSNRHGQKGVVGRVVPDSEMPTLEDGTPVECVVSFIGLHTRQNVGQLWEAAAGRQAKNSNRPVVVPPYRAPAREELAETLEALGNPHRQRLGFPAGGHTEGPVLVGWVYWGCTKHLAAAKLEAAGVESALQVQGEMEYNAFRNNGLADYIIESNGFASAENERAAEQLKPLLEGGLNAVNTPPAPVVRMERQLSKAGFEVVHESDGFGFRWSDRRDDEELPVPVAHPWMSWKVLRRLPLDSGSRSRQEVAQRAERVRLLFESNAPKSLIDHATAALQQSVDAYFAELLTHEDVVPRGRRRFTARAIISPLLFGGVDQVGIPAEIAWTLFGPLLSTRLDVRDVEQRSADAQRALEDEMSRRWIIVNRAPTLSDTTVVAFRPFIVDHAAVELHPLVCRWMSADYDGDMVGLYLPVSEEAQAEVARRISVVGHLRRNPGLLDTLLPTDEALWGLASEAEGRCEAVFAEIRRTLLDDGPEAAVAMVEKAFEEGVAVARRRGPTLDPTCDPWKGRQPASRSEAAEVLSAPRSRAREHGAPEQGLSEPGAPERAVPAEGVSEPGRQEGAAVEPGRQEGAAVEPGVHCFAGAQILAVVSGARGSMDQLLNLFHSRRTDGETVGGGQIDGYDLPTHRRIALDVRRHFHTLLTSLPSVAGDYNASNASKSYRLLARLMRADVPGIVVASAAESGERDPLIDTDAKLATGHRPA